MVYRILGRLIITDSLLQIFLIVFLSTMFTIRDPKPCLQNFSKAVSLKILHTNFGRFFHKKIVIEFFSVTVFFTLSPFKFLLRGPLFTVV